MSNHATYLVVALVCFGAIYLVSMLTYRYIELPGIALGRKLSQRPALPPGPPAMLAQPSVLFESAQQSPK